MSLKGFHIVFIVLSTLLAIGFSVWSFVNETALPAGVASAVIAVALVFYGFWFVKKSKNIIT